ncbi:MAG: DUF3800 domain-containing protein, partial [Dehalococcoidia bacterium]
ACQREKANKGHILFVFDDEERERMRFTDLVSRPPAWSDRYYERSKGQDQLDQVIDVPYFADSRKVALIQLADFMGFFLRRFAEMKEGFVPAKYPDEEKRVSGWMSQLAARSIGRQFIYPRTKREFAADLFWNYAPPSIRELG